MSQVDSDSAEVCDVCGDVCTYNGGEGAGSDADRLCWIWPNGRDVGVNGNGCGPGHLTVPRDIRR